MNMTKIVLTILLDRELNKINRIIDEKIQNHQGYKNEALLHRKIVNRINKLKKSNSVLAVL